MGVTSCVLNPAVCDRYPCRAWFAIFRCQLLVMTGVDKVQTMSKNRDG